MGDTVIIFGGSVSINEKNVVVGAHSKDNVNDPHSGVVYTFTLQDKTWTEDKLLTARDGSSSDKFVWSVVISRDTMLVGALYKYGNRGATYVLVLGGDRLWDEGTRLIPINGIAS